MMGPVLLGTAAGVMVSLLFYALLVTEPPVAYIVGVLATAGVTGWAALECLLCDWADRGGDGHRVRRPPPSPSGKPGGRGLDRLDRATRLSDPVQVIGSDLRNSSPFFRRPPTR